MTGELGLGRIKLINLIIAKHWTRSPETMRFRYNEVLFLIQELLKDEGREYFSEHMGLRGFGIFREFVKMLLYRNLANYDSMVLLTSDKGTGKSSCAMMMARAWCQLIGRQFSPKRHIAYSNADVMNKIDTLNHFEPLIADESVRFACITGDTIIKTKNGDKQIKDLVGQKNIEVYSFNKEKNEIELQIAEKIIYTKNDVIYEMELDNGEKIKCTKEHKFLTKNGWKELQELKEEDEIYGL